MSKSQVTVQPSGEVDRYLAIVHHLCSLVVLGWRTTCLLCVASLVLSTPVASDSYSDMPWEQLHILQPVRISVWYQGEPACVSSAAPSRSLSRCSPSAVSSVKGLSPWPLQQVEAARVGAEHHTDSLCLRFVPQRCHCDADGLHWLPWLVKSRITLPWRCTTLYQPLFSCIIGHQLGKKRFRGLLLSCSSCAPPLASLVSKRTWMEASHLCVHCLNQDLCPICAKHH